MSKMMPFPKRFQQQKHAFIKKQATIIYKQNDTV